MEAIAVHLSPLLVAPEALRGRAVVVIDVLRATTTMVHALAAGARAVLSSLEVEEARSRARAEGADAILGGERGGLPIAGFDLGNSPGEYTRGAVAGRVVVFTTSNGTRALERSRRARRVLVGAFTNLSAVCAALRAEPRVDILCAGQAGEVARDDVLLAGALVERLEGGHAGPSLHDGARIARDLWRGRGPGPLAAALADSSSGRRLLEIGRAADIEAAAEIDLAAIAPELDLETGRVAV
jgi:2-phosphosulfolactate phosphatase